MSTQQPNPNDPSLVDVYDDAGNYLTTLPADTSAVEQVADPMSFAQMPAAAPAGLATNPVVNLASPQAKPTREQVLSAASDASAHGNPDAVPRESEMQPGFADNAQPLTDDGLVSMQPGYADTLPGTEGGWTPTQMQTSGASESSLAARRADVEALAEQERGAALDEALAKEIELEENEKRQALLEREVKDAQAKHAIEQKQIFNRRQQVEQRIATVSAQEPDRNRAFPTGFSAVATFIGAIAGGMLQGLNGGSNQVLDALNRRLESDVQQQRISQSEMLKDLTRQLGSIDAAEDMLRAKQKEVVLKETEARLLGSQNKVAPAQIAAFRKRMNADIARHRIDALTKLERDVTIAEANVPGTQEQPFNAEGYRNQELQQYSQQSGVPIKDAHKQWNAYNKGFQERATLKSGLETAERLISKYEETGDVAGLGPLAKFIPTSVNAKDAQAVRQVMGSVVAQYLKQISGAAVTEQEYARTIENLQGAGDYDSVKRGLGILGQSVRSAEEESEIDNPTFFRLRGELRNMARQRAGGLSEGRSQQEAAAGEPVSIPQSSRIAFVHNNPGNLTYAGQAGATRGEPKAGGGYWAKFESAGDGMRALARQVRLDQDRQLNVRQFVEKYAPSTDGNDVERYLAKFQRLTGADGETMLSEMSPGNVAYALAAIESGSRPTK